MKAFEEWFYGQVCDRCDKVAWINPVGCGTCEMNREQAWKASLKWFYNVAEECEKDCKIDKDYQKLYFHLKQLLKNELGE